MATKITPRASFTILKKQMTQINTAERSFFSAKSQQIAI